MCLLYIVHEYGFGEKYTGVLAHHIVIYRSEM